MSSRLGDDGKGDDVTDHHDNQMSMINFIIKPLTELIAVLHDMKKVTIFCCLYGSEGMYVYMHIHI